MGPGRDALRHKELTDWIERVARTKLDEEFKIAIYELDLAEIIELLGREQDLKDWLEEAMHAMEPNEPVDKPLEQKIRERVKMLTGELQ